MNSRFFTEGHGRLARVDRGGAFHGPCPFSTLMLWISRRCEAASPYR